MTATHTCPGVCTKARPIDDRLFCCAGCWFKLSKRVRDAIGATARMATLSLPRRRAITEAMDEWKALK